MGFVTRELRDYLASHQRHLGRQRDLSETYSASDRPPSRDPVVMKPKPLVALNHLTVPVAMACIRVGESEGHVGAALAAAASSGRTVDYL